MAYKPAATVDTPAYGGRAIIHFHPGKHYYTVSVPELGKTKIYQPGVTSILGVKDKSNALVIWATRNVEIGCNQDLDAHLMTVQENTDPQAFDRERVMIRLATVREIVAKNITNYRKIKEQAADIGSCVHDYLENFLMWREFRDRPQPKRPEYNDLDPTFTREMVDKANHAIDNGLTFYSEHDVKPLTTETPVWSATHGYVGTDDFEGLVDGEKVVLDYKSGKRLYSEVWMQTAAYQAAIQEADPRKKFDARVGVCVTKDGDLDWQRRPNDEFFEKDFNGFLGFLQGWRWDREFGYDPKNPCEVIGPLPPATRSRKAKAQLAKA